MELLVEVGRDICYALAVTSALSVAHVRRDCSASRPKLNPPCRVAVDGLIDGYNSEGEVDEPCAGVKKVVKEGEEKGVSSKVSRNMDEMEWLLRNTQTAFNRIPRSS